MTNNTKPNRRSGGNFCRSAYKRGALVVMLVMSLLGTVLLTFGATSAVAAASTITQPTPLYNTPCMSENAQQQPGGGVLPCTIAQFSPFEAGTTQSQPITFTNSTQGNLTIEVNSVFGNGSPQGYDNSVTEPGVWGWEALVFNSTSNIVLTPGQSTTATMSIGIGNMTTGYTPMIGTYFKVQGAGGPYDITYYVEYPEGSQTYSSVGTPPYPGSSSTAPGPTPIGVQAAQGCVPMPSGTVVGMAAASNDQGYWIVDAAGQVDTCGSAANYGELSAAPSSPIVGMAVDAAGTGYWLVGADGGVYAFGSAVFHGSMAGHQLNAPMVGMAADLATGGYWLLGADGGVFSFDAPFYGSTGNMKLNKPVVGMAATASGGGYWFVASDGGIFAYGNAPFDGSMGGKPLNRPVVGMAPDFATGGYWLVAADGGIFAFGAPFHGSTGALQLAKPIVGMEANAAGSGYRFVASDGGIFSFGSSQFYGSAA